MTEYRGLFVRPDASQGTTPVEARKSLAGMVSQLADGSPRAGLLTPAQVEGTGGWAYSVPAFAVVLSRGSADGVVLTGNDGTISVSTDPAPASGSRVDLVYVLHRDVDNGDPDSGVEVGVAIGDVSGTPVAPSIPTGALALAAAIVSSDDLSTFDSQITQTSTYTGLAGADLHVPFGQVEFSARIPDPVDGMRVWSDADDTLHVRSGGGWQPIVTGEPHHAGQVETDPIPSGSSWTDVASVIFDTPFSMTPAITLTNTTAYGGSDPVMLVVGSATASGFTIRAKCASSKSEQFINWTALAR